MLNTIAIISLILILTGFIYSRKYLTLAGSILTAIMAILFFLIGGLQWLAPPLAFFILSTFWTKILGVSSEKDKTRKFIQVFANGGLALILVIISQFLEIRHIVLLFTSVFAAAAADTWATELGGRFGGRPLSLRTFRFTKTGESGAITIIGIIASFLGSFSVAASAYLFGLINLTQFVLISLSGLAGSLFDSVLGAWGQVIWVNSLGDQKEEINQTEKATYKRLRGLSFINNDAVNFLSTCFSVVVTLIFIQYFR